MKTKLQSVLLTASLLALPALLQAQPTAHYTPGVEGIKGASLPPPGFYVRDYNVAYIGTQGNDPAGRENKAANLDSFVYANVPRLIYITDTKILGGFLGVDGLLPLEYQSVRVTLPPYNSAPYKHSTFGVGDFFAEGTLSWHLTQFDFSAAAGSWMPTGDSAAPPTTRAGLGYWTPMLTAGATWYVDKDKTWAVSALNRYEFNTESRDTHQTPGEAYTLEWGVSKSITKTIEVGAVGYYQQQVTRDHGRGTLDPYRDRVASVGAEISTMCPKCMFFVSARYLYEFMAESRAQGHTIALTLTKRF